MSNDKNNDNPLATSQNQRSIQDSPILKGQYEGRLIKDRYQIEKELGRGGVGVVYLARDKQLAFKPVVIKVLLEGANQNEWFKKKFRQEMEALVRLDHPSVVGVIDAGQLPDGNPFIVMQYVEGVNLRSLITCEGMDLEQVAHIIRQVGYALSAAHDKGVYHRDLKPENIMVQMLAEDELQVKLIDFGIATVKDSQQASNSQVTKVAGSIAYMAPEQLMGKPSSASDIYALGVIAYEMVTGRRPFNPESPFQLYDMQKAGVRIRPVDLRPSLTEKAQEVILQALSFEPSQRQRKAKEFSDQLAQALTSHSQNLTTYRQSFIKTVPATRANISAPKTATTGTQFVLLCKRNQQPDEQVLTVLETQLLAAGYKIFIDRHLTIGVEWAKEIERQIRNADAVIVLLSATSVTSEMLTYEIQVAHEATQKQKGKPRLLPVRVNYRGALPEPLASILNPLEYVLWNGSQDNQNLVKQLLNSLQASATQEIANRQRKLEAVGGAVPLDSEFYITRRTDEEFRSAIARQDSIVLVNGARQMGKTSLLARGLQQARQAGAKVVLTDFQMLNASHLESIETLYLALGEWLADQLDLEVFPEDMWNSGRGASMNFGKYIRREVLGKISSSLVWGMDEIDRLFSCDYASEVFGLFRSWHNARALDPAGPWQRLTLAIAYATEAHLFITDVNQSPFNVGTRLELDDFTFDQVMELNRRYGSPLQTSGEVARFFHLVGGHPYLVRRGFHEMASQGMALIKFEVQADRDEGLFGDHLRRILVLLAQDSGLCEVVRQVLQGKPCSPVESFYRLRSAGLMSGDSAKEAKLRCQLYASYLERHLL